MLDRIKAVPWSDYAQPEWNKPSSIVDALARVVRGEGGACDSLLYAVGNNHAGTYYPVLIAVIPFLEEIVEAGEGSSRHLALDVLLDLYGSFHPQPGYEEVDLPAGGKRSVEAALRERMRSLHPALKRIASEGGLSAALAEELSQLVDKDGASAEAGGFRFRATEAFGLFGRGIVFRGEVLRGQIEVGRPVSIVGGARRHNARVVAIELNRSLLERSQVGVELGLLLNDFDEPQMRRMLSLADVPGDVPALPTPADVLGVEFPVDIVDITMTSVAVQITRYVDGSFPGWVELLLHDARGTAWTFVEKVPVVSAESLTASSAFPRAGAIACEVVAGSSEVTGAGLVEIDTSRPWGIEAKDGSTRFVVRSSQLVGRP